MVTPVGSATVMMNSGCAFMISQAERLLHALKPLLSLVLIGKGADLDMEGTWLIHVAGYRHRCGRQRLGFLRLLRLRGARGAL